MARLDELGEDWIVHELIRRHLGAPSWGVEVGAGADDAAVFAPLPAQTGLVVTVDACPTPVVDLLGVGSWRDWGRLAGVISLSDLAAMGAAPLGLLSSTYMPPGMQHHEYEMYLEGLDEVCREFNAPIVGGNIREGTPFAATTVALGTCLEGNAFRRAGAGAGDALICVGGAGVFWSAVLHLIEGGSVDSLSGTQFAALYRPTPRLRESLRLQDLGVVTAAVDASDGLGAAVSELCRSSSLGAVIRFEGFPIDPGVEASAARASVPLERLLLAWGDWQLVVAVTRDNVPSALAALEACGSSGFMLGELTDEPGLVEVWPGTFGERAVTDDLASTRFVDSSYLKDGLVGYVERLRRERS